MKTGNIEQRNVLPASRWQNPERSITELPARRLQHVANCAWMFLISVIVLSAFANSAFAETILLKNAVVHTVSKETMTNGSVFIDNGKIMRVFGLLDDSFVIPSDTKQIDLNGLHLYPGLIALDTALGLSEISGVRSTRDFAEVGDYTPDVQSW
ncbi:MAG: hypothetical protein ABIR24_09395, partial [Verrucomicrobiota bacterium]